MLKDKMLKRISIFVMVFLILFTNFLGGFKAYAAVEPDAEIEATVDEYMKAREKLFKNNNGKKLAEVTVAGIVRDEKLHRELYEELGVKVKKIEYKIKSIIDSDSFVEIIVLETLNYIKDKEKLECETEHLFTLMKDEDENWMVVSDAYYEDITEYMSCSYVPADGGISLFAVSDIGIPTIVGVAETQVGYLEKASNSNLENFTENAGSGDYTKYGDWYGHNPGPWCAMFVSWCANEAGINSEMFPRYKKCSIGMSTFKTMGRFYYSSEYNGSYIPKAGDVFFTGTSETNAEHTGIVVSVSGTTMTIIHGNASCAVRKDTMQLTDSKLIGFVTSCVHNIVQKYNISYHWNACSICGSQMSIKIAHSFNSLGKCRLCPASQTSTAALTDSFFME